MLRMRSETEVALAVRPIRWVALVFGVAMVPMVVMVPVQTTLVAVAVLVRVQQLRVLIPLLRLGLRVRVLVVLAVPAERITQTELPGMATRPFMAVAAVVVAGITLREHPGVVQVVTARSS